MSLTKITRDDERLELAIGLVAPVGVDVSHVQNIITDYLKQFGYEVNSIQLSSLIKTINGLETEIVEEPEYERINSHMTAGDESRQKAGRGDFLAALAIGKIRQQRKDGTPFTGKAHLFRSLKHPDEVQLLRNVYGDGFYLLSIASSRAQRLKYLIEQKGIPKAKAEKLIKRDEEEEFELGQHMRDAFHLADCFVDIDESGASNHIGRFLDLIFGKPDLTPTKDEYAMFLAFAASLRSGDLSRQVGAVVTSMNNEVIATGANDVPCYGGGLYWTDHGDSDNRDFKRGYDSNEYHRNEIVTAIMRKISPETKDFQELLKKGTELLKDTGIFDITEYGRAVHAEMEAILSCARSGVSPRNGTLYTTTFPCHNCAKHITSAGLKRVVFVEPYPKSLATVLHSDAIVLDYEKESKEENNKIRFEPFVGIGPRHFIDLFSMTLSSGRKIKRKQNGEVVKWGRNSTFIRMPLIPMSYIEKEIFVHAEIDQLMEKIYANSKKH